MPTDPLVNRLVADLKPVRRRSAATEAALLALAFVTLAVTSTLSRHGGPTFGLRRD